MSEYDTIKHREYGIVEGVKHREYTSGWEKFENGRLSCFNPEHGWELVPKEEWITIEVVRGEWERVDPKPDFLVYHRLYGGPTALRWRYPSPKKGQAT